MCEVDEVLDSSVLSVEFETAVVESPGDGRACCTTAFSPSMKSTEYV
jgi:hypothetical protein